MHVWIYRIWHYPGAHHYHVLVDSVKYDEFTSSKSLRRDDMRDIAAGYREALEGYNGMETTGTTDAPSEG